MLEILPGQTVVDMVEAAARRSKTRNCLDDIQELDATGLSMEEIMRFLTTGERPRLKDYVRGVLRRSQRQGDGKQG